jgi:hypothetical protein
MTASEAVRLVIFGGVGVIAQVIIYALYCNDVAFYLDGYTTSLVQLLFSTILMFIVYRPLFHCHLSEDTGRQRFFGGLMVVTYFMLTASRLPIPTWPLGLCALGGLETSRKRVVVMRFVVAILLIAATYLIMQDVVNASRMGVTFWDQEVPDDLLVAIYVTTGGVFSFAVFMLGQTRTLRMHTAGIIRHSLLMGIPFIGIVWGITWIPGIDTGSVRYGPADPPESFAVAIYIVLSAILKVVILATVVEFIKFGRLFEYLALSSVAYIVFPAITSTALMGILPLDSVVGVILLVFGLICAFGMALFCPPERYTTDATRRNMQCSACAESKTWFGCMTRFSDWAGPRTVVSALEDEEDDAPCRARDDGSSNVEAPARRPPFTRGDNEQNFFEVESEDALRAPGPQKDRHSMYSDSPYRAMPGETNGNADKV